MEINLPKHQLPYLRCKAYAVPRVTPYLLGPLKICGQPSDATIDVSTSVQYTAYPEFKWRACQTHAKELPSELVHWDPSIGTDVKPNRYGTDIDWV